MSRTWWYVLSGGFGVRQFVAGRKCDRAQAVVGIARECGVQVAQVEQCWPFRPAEDVYRPGMYRRERRA